MQKTVQLTEHEYETLLKNKAYREAELLDIRFSQDLMSDGYKVIFHMKDRGAVELGTIKFNRDQDMITLAKYWDIKAFRKNIL